VRRNGTRAPGVLSQPHGVRMTPIASVSRSVRDHGGVAATFELHRDGFTKDDLRQAVRTRTVVRVRQGWYASRGTHPVILAALRVGGRPTCMTGLGLQGFWEHPHDGLHVAIDPHSCRLRSPHDKDVRLATMAETGVHAHWRPGATGSKLLLTPIACLSDLINCQPAEVVAASAGSVLHERPDLQAEWLALLEAIPAKRRQTLGEIDGVCESGTESLVWFRLQSYRFPLRRQVRIPGVGWVDFRLGRSLVIEVDSVAYHTDPDQFEKDRRRDAVLSALGFRVLRFSYKQIMERWPEVESAILAAIIRGDHL